MKRANLCLPARLWLAPSIRRDKCTASRYTPLTCERTSCVAPGVLSPASVPPGVAWAAGRAIAWTSNIHHDTLSLRKLLIINVALSRKGTPTSTSTCRVMCATGRSASPKTSPRWSGACSRRSGGGRGSAVGGVV
jgi:hypothetical protein